MNRQDLEARLREDAERLQVRCPPQPGRRVSARIRQQERLPRPRPFGIPALAGAFGVFTAIAVAWLLWPAAGIEESGGRTLDLNAAPVVATSDQVLATREAALENEWRLIERDLRNLRDHVTATFDLNPGS